MCLHSKGQYHLSVGEWESAILCLKKALKLSKDVFDSTHLQVYIAVRHQVVLQILLCFLVCVSLYWQRVMIKGFFVASP